MDLGSGDTTSRAEWLWLTSELGGLGCRLRGGRVAHPELGCCVVGPGLGGGRAGAVLGIRGRPGAGQLRRWAWGWVSGLDLETGCWELDSELCCCGVDSELACWGGRSPGASFLTSSLPFFMVDPPDLSVQHHMELPNVPAPRRGAVCPALWGKALKARLG